MSKKRNKITSRVTCNQIEALISYMEEHTLFARGQITQLGPQGHLKYEQMWVTLSNQLNNIGPCKKTVSSWQETWKSLRLKAKNRKATFLKAYDKTGHTDPNVQLSEHDERITSIFGKYGIGLNIIAEAGFSNFTFKETDSDITEKCFPYSIEPFDFYDSVFERDMMNEVQKFREEVKSLLHLSTPRKPVVRPNQEQKNSMLQFMENHPHFAVNYYSNDDLWTELLEFLHGIGPTRSLKSWQKTWCDCIRAAEQSHQLSKAGINDAMTDFHFRIFNLVNGRNSENENSPLNTTSSGMVQTVSFNEQVADVTPPKIMKKDLTLTPSNYQSLSRPATTVRSTSYPFTPITTVAHLSANSTIVQSIQPTSTICSTRSPLTPITFPSTTSRTTHSLTLGTTSASAHASTSASGGAQRKALTFMSAFKNSQEEMIRKITECFEQQNIVIAKVFQDQNNTLSLLPHVIAAEVNQAINNCLKNQRCNNCNNALQLSNENTMPLESNIADPCDNTEGVGEAEENCEIQEESPFEEEYATEYLLIPDEFNESEETEPNDQQNL